MKNTNTLPNEHYTDIYNEEQSTQFIVRPLHLIGTAMLLVAWAYLGTILIG